MFHWTFPVHCVSLWIRNRADVSWVMLFLYCCRIIQILLINDQTGGKRNIRGCLRWWRIRLQCKRPGFDPWVGKIPWRRKWLFIPVFLPGDSHGQRSLMGYSPWGHKESDMTEQPILHFLSSSHIVALKSWGKKQLNVWTSASPSLIQD